MDYKVVLSDLFVSDLKEIARYSMIQADGGTADRVGQRLLDCALDTGKNPFIGTLVGQRPGIRKMLSYPYLIYYEVNEAERSIEVLRAWHGARDPKSLRLNE